MRDAQFFVMDSSRFIGKVFQQALIHPQKGNLIECVEKLLKAIVVGNHDKILPALVFRHPIFHAFERNGDDAGFILGNRFYFAFAVHHTAGKSHGTGFAGIEVVQKELISAICRLA